MQRSHFIRSVRRTGLSLAGGALALFVLLPSAPGMLFNDPTKVNVLREYNPDGSRAGSRSAAIVGASWNGPIAATSGDGSKTQGDGFDAGDYVSETYTLSAAQTVGSWTLYNFGGNRMASSMTLSGLVSGVWTQLDTFNPVNTLLINRSFTPATVSALKYVAAGPNLTGGTDPYFQLHDIRVHPDVSTSQPLYGIKYPYTAAAHDLLHDTGRVAGGSVSPNLNIAGSGWLQPNGSIISNWVAASGSYTSIYDNNYENSYVLTGTSDPSNFAYVRLDLASPTQLDLAHLGFYDSQSWNNWAVYASALASPNSNLAADWVKIFETTGSSGQNYLVNFGANAGEYQHLLFLWRAASSGNTGAFTELELYGFTTIPEPATAFLLGLGGLLVWRRVRRS